ncbi:MAG: MFS transporter [Candidatus Hydrogenedentes bacterium]|nr:MFS transporter [Candidatus Hydrogenedentota bacterium]
MTKQERSWILYDCANSAQTLIVTTSILPIFFKTYAAKGMEDVESTFYWSIGNTVAMIFVAIMSPILGALADHRGYKKRLFITFLFIGLIATAALPAVQEGQWLFCLVLFGISTIGFYGAVVFYDSFLVDVASKDRMDWISSSGFAWGYVASTVPYIACMLMIGQFERFGFSSKLEPTRLAFIVTAIWWFVLSIPMLRNVRQVHYVAEHANPVAESLSRLGATLKNIPKYKALFGFLIAYFLYIDGVHTIYKLAIAFGLDIGIPQDELLKVLLVTQIVAFPCAILFGYLAKYFGAKRMVLIGIGMYFLVTSLAYFIREVWHFWALGMMIAFAQGGIQSLSRSMFAKLVPPENAAQFFGFYDIFGKFATILGPVMVGGIGWATGDTRMGVFSLIILFAAGGLLLMRVDESKSIAPNAT